MQKRRQEVGVAIGRMALGARDYLFARLTFGQLANHGLEGAEVEPLIKEVEVVRSAVLDWRRDRLGEILGDLTRGLGKAESETESEAESGTKTEQTAGDFLLDDYVAEALAYRDLQTVERSWARIWRS
ncbi:MAG: hypothetical protein QF752_07040 [Planctomycetota bacterium]|jgi:hypothetical protein|nr:hypothetical protein [Planctomycetota bacterium]